MERPERLPDRLWASLPANDPRYTEMRLYLATIQGRGQSSPVARMLGEWALIGFLIQTGRMSLAGPGDAQLPVLPRLNAPDPETVMQEVRAIVAAADEFGVD